MVVALVVESEVGVAALGAVHRDVGLLNERLDIGSVLGVERDADAGLRVDLDVLEFEGRAQRGRDRLRQSHRRVAVAAVAEDRKLIATEPRDLVAATELLPETLSDLLQEQVAVPMAKRVVDLFEAVEVDEQQTGRLGV